MAPAFGQQVTVTFEWDANPASDGVTEYNLYESISNGPYVQVASVTGDVLTVNQAVNIDGQRHRYVLRAGSPFGESGDSNVVVLTARKPGNPRNLRVTVVVALP